MRKVDGPVYNTEIPEGALVVDGVIAPMAKMYAGRSIRQALSKEAERELLEAALAGNQRARDRLIEVHMEYAARVAHSYYKIGRYWEMTLDECVAEAEFCLVNCINKFNLSSCASFSTFLHHQLRGHFKEVFNERRKFGIMCFPQHTSAVVDIETSGDGDEDEGRPQGMDRFPATNGDSVEALLTEFQVYHDVHATLKLLPHRQRTILERKYGIGCAPLPDRKIAARAGELGIADKDKLTRQWITIQRGKSLRLARRILDTI